MNWSKLENNANGFGVLEAHGWPSRTSAWPTIVLPGFRASVSQILSSDPFALLIFNLIYLLHDLNAERMCYNPHKFIININGHN